MRYNFIYRLQFINAENPYNWPLNKKNIMTPEKYYKYWLTQTEYRFNDKNNSQTAKKYSCKNIRHTYKWSYIQFKNRSKFLYLIPIKLADI